jgi:hypothetical protein
MAQGPSPLGIMASIIASAGPDDPEMIARRIVMGLDRAGYGVHPKSDLIPIRPNPGAREPRGLVSLAGSEP